MTSTQPTRAHHGAAISTVLLLLGLSLLLAGCGSGSGAAVESTPLQAADTGSADTYTGPAPRDTDVQRFRINLWDNLRGDDRCGQCHSAGGQDPGFARSDDVNLAYDATLALVDLSRPAESRLVGKVRGGHNCWLGDAGACADLMTRWVQNWAGDAGADGEGGVRRVAFTAPPAQEPGDSRSFPVASAGYAATVHPLVRQYCAGCHAEGAGVAIRPFFADADADAAYAAARTLINLDTPADSRLAVRLGAEFHNCWGACSDDAAAMTTAIQAFADGIPLTELDPDLVTSLALGLPDGIVASSGGRYEASAIALWEFKTGSGGTAYDTSGVAPAIDLTLSGAVDWVGGWGLRFTGGKAQGATAASRKLHERITASGEFSVELWAAPGNVTQEEARLFAYSGGTGVRNAGVHQTLYNWDALVRDAGTDANALPALSTADAAERARATLQHVVLTYDPENGRRIYVDGVFTDDLDAAGGASLNDWDDSLAVVFGNEVSLDRAWAGTLRLAAVFDRALTPEQIQRNFAAGVGERFFLLFGIGERIGDPGAYVVFEVSRFDSWSYLFSAPFVIDLDGGLAAPFALRGLRIGINGREAGVGQAFASLDTSVDPANYDPDLGVALSSQATIIALEKGPELDQFFLSFDQLGGLEHVRVEASPPPPTAPADQDPAPQLGLRIFDAVDATLSAVTGVPRTQPDVAVTFATVRQQLPVVPDVDGFLSSHQMAVTQLAISYCNALVEDSSLRASRFPGFAFSAAPASAFDSAGRAALLDPLLERTLHSGLASQPDPAVVRAELDALIDGLTACGDSCPAGRTATVAKAVCAAAVGGATLLVH